MQFKLLNFHKMLANFASNIIGVFIPLILYTYTNSITISILYLMSQYTLRISFTVLFRKYIEKRPQLFLLLRIFPMLIYSSMVLVLDYNLWLAVVCICVFSATSDSFNAFSNEVLLNYSSLNRSGKSFGVTRLFEQLGVIASVLAGGMFLDNFDKSVVIIISIIIYLISVMPLMFYYIKFRKSPDFNKEAISNAFLTQGQRQERTKKAKAVSKKILTSYFLIYLLMCFIDSLVHVYNLYMFTTIGAFTFASLVSASFNGAFGLSSYVVGKLNEKYDTTLMAMVGSLIMAGLIVVLPFVGNEIVVIIIFSVIGGLYPLSSIFLIERMLIKTRILGISNQALFNREKASSLGKIGGYVFGVFGTLLPAFFAIAAAFALFGILIPIREEKTRKILINYLESD